MEDAFTKLQSSKQDFYEAMDMLWNEYQTLDESKDQEQHQIGRLMN